MIKFSLQIQLIIQFVSKFPMQYESKLETALSDFSTMKNQKSLPPKMQIKLKYLEAKILQKQFDQEIYELLPSYEKVSLEQMNEETQISLFCSIMGCLSGRELIVYFTHEKASIRKDATFTMWSKCYINCDSNQFSIKKHIQDIDTWLIFKMNQIKISKAYKEYKKKVVFGIIFNNIKYYVGFQQEGTCKRIHGILIQLAKEKASQNKQKDVVKKIYSTIPSSEDGRINESRIAKTSKVTNAIVSNFEFEKDDIKEEEEIFEEKINKEEREFLEHMQELVNRSKLSNDTDYKLVQNIENGRILQSVKDNKIKIFVLIERCPMENIIENYLKMSGWNTEVEEFKIISKVNINTYVVYLRFKKYSFISLGRDSYVTITCFKSCQNCSGQSQSPQTMSNSRVKSEDNHKMYLIISNFANEELEKYSSVTRASFNQIIELSTNSESKELVLLTILTDADFKGYSNINDNINMTLHLFRSITSFPKFCKEQQFSSHLNTLFHINSCQCKPASRKICYVKEDKSLTSSRKNSEANSQVELPTSIKDEEEEEQERFQFPNCSFSTQKTDQRSNKKDNKVYHHDQHYQKVLPTKVFEEEEIKEQAEQDTFQTCISDYHKDKTNQKIIDFIRNRTYQKYYLQHRFTQEEASEEYKKSKYTRNTRKDFLMQNGRWRLVNDELIFINQEILKVQKEILKLILKQISSNFFAGKSIMNMSLPVQIFANGSLLELIAVTFGFFPKFINDAVNSNNLIQQMKNVILACQFINSCAPNIEKPFNPILGETFQCSIGGIPFYFEQISHHPPISNFYSKTNDFQFSGSIDIHIDIGLNSAHSKVSNFGNLKFFKSKTEYVLKYFDVELSGLMFGQRKLKAANRAYAYEVTNDVFSEMSIGKEKKKIYQLNEKIKSTDLVGGIFKVNNNFGKRFLHMDKKKNYQGLKLDDIVEKYCEITGKWYGNVYFDKVLYKSITSGPDPVRIERPIFLLPSDSLFRQDICYKKWNMIDKSNQTKQFLQNLQRDDKKAREKMVKSKQK